MDNQQSTHHFACEENAEGMWQCVCENCCIWICACAASTFCCVSFKCVFLFPSVSCNGFIPAMAFNRREHQSTRLTFNPKPGQVEKHTCMHIACTYMYTKETDTHPNTLSAAFLHIQKHKSKPEDEPVDYWTLWILQSDEGMWTELLEEDREETVKNKVMNKDRWKGLEGKCFPHQSIGWDIDRAAQRYRWSRRTGNWCIDVCDVFLIARVSLDSQACTPSCCTRHLCGSATPQLPLPFSPCEQINPTCSPLVLLVLLAFSHFTSSLLCFGL